MNATHAAHSPETPRNEAGISARLHAPGSGLFPATPGRLTLIPLAFVLLLVLFLPPARATTIGTPGPGAGQFNRPSGVAVDQSTGSFYVVDGENQRIDKFDAQGHFLFAFGWGVRDGAEELQTCTSATTCRGGISGSGAGQFAFFVGGAVSVDQSTGNVYVADRNNHRVQKFDAEGHFLLAFGGDAVAHGPDNSANDEKQKLSVAASGGTFKLRLAPVYSAFTEAGAETATLPYNATAAQLKTALEALPAIGGNGGTVSVSGGPGDATGSSPYEITFEGNLAGDDIPLLALNRDNLGPAAVGAHLQCSSALTTETIEYQWLRNAAPIPGATTASYIATAADAGTAIQCQVTARNSSAGLTHVANPPQVIAPAPGTAAPVAPTEISAPSATNDLVLGGPGGQTITCQPGQWTGAPSFSYQWYRNGAPIPGATDSTYSVATVDLATAAAFQCSVTGTNAGAATTLISNPRFTTAPPRNLLGLFINPLDFASMGLATVAQGGDPEVCRPADTCKQSDIGLANGQFDPWPEGFGQAPRFAEVSNLIATGPAGAVYVAGEDRIQRFDSSGAYNGQLSLPGAGKVLALAVNSSGDIYLTAENLSGVHEYELGGAEIGTPLDQTGEPQALAIGAADEIYVRDSADGTTQILGYESSGAQTTLIRAAEIDGPQPAGGLALGDTAGLLYAPSAPRHYLVTIPIPPPGPAIEPGSERITEILSIAATAHASVNPQSKSTTFHFQYVDDTHFKSEAGFASSHTLSTPESASVGSDFAAHDVEGQLTGLTPETTYHFRAVATNEKGTVTGEGATFTTQAPLLLDPQPPTAVTITGATLRVFLNPLGLHTTYQFEYGPTTSYGTSTPSADAGEATAFLSESAPISGLQPGSTYHFRVVATNSAGTQLGPDFAFTTSPASCPNEVLRQENTSVDLPECRAYEQVSPIDKASNPAALEDLSSNGDRVTFNSVGVFADEPSTGQNNYLAIRGSAGWRTEGIDVPWSLGTLFTGAPQMASGDLSEFVSATVALDSTGPNIGTSKTRALFLRHPDGSWTQASPALQAIDPKETPPEAFLVSGSADLSHLLFGLSERLLPVDKIPGWIIDITSGLNVRFYEVVDADTTSPALRLLDVDNSGVQLPLCQNNALQAAAAGLAEPLVSRDGGTVFFTTWSSALPGGCAEPNGARPYQLLARLDGQTTVDLSQPSPSECGSGPAVTEEACRNAPLAGAAFRGASADGSKAFFLSTQQLTDDASEDPKSSDGVDPFAISRCARDAEGRTGCNLYMYDFDRPTGHHLAALSAGDTSGVGPQVHAVLDASADGSHVYFTAGGLLSGEPNALGQFAQPGAENLYVSDTASGSVAFLADLCSASERSGSFVGAAQCPGSGDDSAFLSRIDRGEPALDITPDGRYLVFTTYAQLTPDDTNLAADVYRYDAQSGGLVRVSTGHEGQDQNGNGGGQDATLGTHRGGLNRNWALPVHVVSDDGQTVVFRTARPLQNTAENGLANAYEWHQGQVTLISGGRSTVAPSKTIRLSSSGRDILFTAAQGLVPTDVDGLLDVYDARIDGGFPLPPPAPPTCESPEQCHEGATQESPQPILGTEGFRGPGNPSPKNCKKGLALKHDKCVKGKSHRHKHSKHHKPSGTEKGGRK